MPKYTLTISSKNKKSLTNFVTFLKQNLSIFKIFNISKVEEKKGKRTLVSVLKSPHVNKTAQEKYEYRTYSYVIQTYSFKTQKYILLLKHLKNDMFSEIKIKITIFIKNGTKSNIKTKFVTLKNYNLNWSYKKNIQMKNSQQSKKIKKFNCLKNITKISSYLKVIDCLGEFEINKQLYVIATN